MKKNLYFLLWPLGLVYSCAEEPLKMHPQIRYAFHANEITGETSDHLRILANPDKVVRTIQEVEGVKKPYFAPLAFFCDPNDEPPNIVLTAAVCRPFLGGYFRDRMLDLSQRPYIPPHVYGGARLIDKANPMGEKR